MRIMNHKDKGCQIRTTLYCLRVRVKGRFRVNTEINSLAPQMTGIYVIFHVFLTVYPGMTLGNEQLDAQLLYIIRFYYYNPLHVSSKSVLIIRRSNCINTASVIVFPVSDRSVCRLKKNQFLLNLHTGQNTITDAMLIQFDLLMMSTELLETCKG
jgi:hypothetical protein